MAWTFTTLKSAIQDYTNNTETTFTSYLDEFIVNTEDRILKMVELPFFRKNVTGSLTSGNEYLLFKDVNFIRESYPSSSTTGIPKYYAVFDVDSFIVAPTPNANSTVELHYQYKPTSITTSGDGTSWIGTNASDCLLYGSLVEAYTFMKGEADVMQNYKERFAQSIDRLKVLGEGRETKDNYRTGTTRKAVT